MPVIAVEPTVRDVGEFGLIRAVTARLPQGPAVLLGPGDDAAVLAAPDGRVVVSTDLLVEGRHFRRDWMTGYDVGRRAAAQNLADIAAMGAVPTALVVGLAVPGTLALSWAEALADGLRDECALVGASVVGGDVVAADAVTITGTVLGDLQGRAPVRRGGAVVGDLVIVVGRLGWSAAGLSVLREGDQIKREKFAKFVDAYRRPQPPYGAGPALADLGATAMIDVSDGLAQDLGHVAAAAGVQVQVDAGRLAAAFVDPDLRAALGDPTSVWRGGEDHALAATIPVSVRGRAERLGGHVIGRVARGEGVVDADSGEPLSGGHDHFR